MIAMDPYEIDRLWRASMTPEQLLALDAAEDAIQRIRHQADAIRTHFAEKSGHMVESELRKMAADAERDFMNSTAPTRNMISDIFAMLPPKPILVPADSVNNKIRCGS